MQRSVALASPRGAAGSAFTDMRPEVSWISQASINHWDLLGKVGAVAGVVGLLSYINASQIQKRRRRRSLGACSSRRSSGASTTGERPPPSEPDTPKSSGMTPDFGTPVLGSPMVEQDLSPEFGTPAIRRQMSVSPKPLRPADVVLLPTPVMKCPTKVEPSISESELRRKLSKQLEKLEGSPQEVRASRLAFDSPPPSARRSEAGSMAGRHSQKNSLKKGEGFSSPCGRIAPELRDKLITVRRKLADFEPDE